MNSACHMRQRLRLHVAENLCIVVLLSLFCLSGTSLAQETDRLPTFVELEAEGAVIGEIRIDNQNIFDLDNPEENNVFYRLTNTLHIRTRPDVIRRALLFKTGEPVSVQVIEETERNLRDNSYLYDVEIRPIAYKDGVVDIEVITKDTWTLDPGLGFSRKGGENESKYGLKELNLLGTGIGFEWQRTEVDAGTKDQFLFNNDQVFGTRVRFNYAYDELDDGEAQSAALVRPFYALDSRWTAGVQGGFIDQLDVVTDATYQRDRLFASAFGGWSKGLINGWTQRYSAGLDYLQDTYELLPGQTGPDTEPLDETRVSPFVRYEVIEDRFLKTKNRNQIERPEFFLLGFASDLKIGYASTALGSTRPAWTYLASLNKGWDFPRNQILVANGSVAGVYAGSDDEDQLLSGEVQYFAPRSNRAQTFVGLAVDAGNDVFESNQLTLGGENGLPGYPANYQSGDRRVVLNLEQRYYTDWYPFRLFRVGGGVFFDTGRAWGGEQDETVDDGWLSNIGFGLRVFSVRSAFGTVWRLDVAFPINAPDDIPDHQILFYRSTNF
jgi:outer membrane protein assembly factor BamA